MVRKSLAAMVAVLFLVGGMFAAEIKCMFVKYEEGKITVKVDDKEKTYKVDEDATMKQKDKKTGEFKEMKISKMLGKLKEDTKIVLTTDDKDMVTGVKMDGKGKAKPKTDK